MIHLSLSENCGGVGLNTKAKNMKIYALHKHEAPLLKIILLKLIKYKN